MWAIIIGIPIGLHSKMLYSEAMSEELKNRIPIETPHEPLTRNALIEGYAPTDNEIRHCTRCGQELNVHQANLSRFHSVRECERCRKS